jgi:hypothetical protein
MTEAFPIEQRKLRNGELAFRKIPEVQLQFKRAGVMTATPTAVCSHMRINELHIISLSSGQKCRVGRPGLVNVIIAVSCAGVGHQLHHAQVDDVPSPPSVNYGRAAHGANPRHRDEVNFPEPMLRFPGGALWMLPCPGPSVVFPLLRLPPFDATNFQFMSFRGVLYENLRIPTDRTGSHSVVHIYVG